VRGLRRLLRPLATILSFIAGFMFIGAARDWVPGVSGLGGLALIFGIIAFVIFVHELGHALAYRWQGGVVEEFAVLLLAWRRRPVVGRGHIGWARWLGGDVGGYVIGHFGATIATRRKHLLVAAGGPLANFALSALCLIAAWALSLAMPSYWTDQAPAPEQSVIVEGPLPLGAVPARLPDEVDVRAILDEVDQLHRLNIAQGVVMLIALNSLTVGLINLIPFTGSDGAAMLRLVLRRRRQWDHL
jgi:membrane-associated protease RseP (regulator of RpoE activity)